MKEMIGTFLKFLFIGVGCTILIACFFACYVEVFESKMYVKNTVENVTTHLSEKYPHKTFEITSEIDAETTYQFVEVVDEQGEKYFVTTYADLFGKEGLSKTRDTVQYKEVNDAIMERFKEIFKLDNISKDNFNKDLTQSPFPVNKKFNGNNLDEVIANTNFRDIEFYYNPADTNVDIESLPEEDKDFLDNFTIVSVTE